MSRMKTVSTPHKMEQLTGEERDALPDHTELDNVTRSLGVVLGATPFGDPREIAIAEMETTYGAKFVAECRYLLRRHREEGRRTIAARRTPLLAMLRRAYVYALCDSLCDEIEEAKNIARASEHREQLASSVRTENTRIFGRLRIQDAIPDGWSFAANEVWVLSDPAEWSFLAIEEISKANRKVHIGMRLASLRTSMEYLEERVKGTKPLLASLRIAHQSTQYDELVHCLKFPELRRKMKGLKLGKAL